MTEAIIIVVLIVVFLAFLCLTAFGLSHEDNIKKWARENELEILSLKECSISETPFTWILTSKDARFFTIEVKDKSGNSQRGKLWTGGSFSNAIFRMSPRVVWDAEKEI